ncbi:hypothetical protein GUJ93_ZPchr0007g4477 [Zizania palustris]|uniref:NAC domain-containing protein n=1 Tax=Zizania palustris TaxID=103762 RepID=A0A8J5T010_ZIZPA|nr:hypothetical protein GUJ93_ZPchr0007g4477 [Zizania palustris]
MESQPCEQELVDSFLRPRVVSGDKSCKFIHEANVYAADPANLTRKFAPAVASNGDEAWYFFSTVRTMKGGRRARTVGDGAGCWHSESGVKPVVGGSGRRRRRLGHRQRFSFVTKDDGGQRIRSGWLMMELGLDSEGQKDEELVLSKVYFSRRAPNAKFAATSCPHKMKIDATDASPPSRQRCRTVRASPDEASAPEALSEEEDPMSNESEDAPQEDDCVGGCGIVSWWLRNRRSLLGEAYNEQCPAPDILSVLPDTSACAFSLLTWMQNQPDVPATYGGGEAHSEKYCPAPEVLPDTGAYAFDLLTWMQNQPNVPATYGDQPNVPATYGGGKDDEAHSEKAEKYYPAPEVLPDTGAYAFNLLTWMQNQPDVPATYGGGLAAKTTRHIARILPGTGACEFDLLTWMQNQPDVPATYNGGDNEETRSEKSSLAPEVLPDTGGALDLFVPFTRFSSFTSFPCSPSPAVESNCSSYEPSLGLLGMPEIKEFLRRAPPPATLQLHSFHPVMTSRKQDV